MPEKEAVAKVSVCIPTHNGAAFLEEAIRGVLSQSFQDFELLIVDDGSTDPTLDIARSFSDPRLRVFQNETRLGIPANWNRAVSLARGEFVCLFHQDDVMLPENLARKTAVLAADPGVSFVHSAVEFLVETAAPNLPLDWVDKSAEDYVVDGRAYFYKLLFSNRICAPAVVVRRSHLLRAGQFDERLGFACDYAMWMRLCAEGNVGFISRPLLLYRWHQQNASHAFRFEREVDETLLARQDALRYYADRTGERQDTQVFLHALDTLADWHRRVVALDAQSERQLAYIREVEQMREKLWAEVQRVGKAWEEQHRYIQGLEQMKNKIWEDAQRVGKSWEEQKAHIENQQRYITDLERERTRLSTEVTRLIAEGQVLKAELSRRLPERLWRFARRMGSGIRSRLTFSQAKE
jgi:glycosyltransferase involved in cell wall biosynthesis